MNCEKQINYNKALNILAEFSKSDKCKGNL